jgi:hypothetical protein
MINRVATILFILLANIVLLAHTVIPHHHHNEKICVIDSHCDDHSNSAAEEHNHESHEHDNSQNKTNCVLDLTYIAPVFQGKQELISVIIFNLYPNAHCLQAILLGAYVFDNKTGMHYSDAPPIFFNASLYSNFVNRIQGLRAPPIA